LGAYPNGGWDVDRFLGLQVITIGFNFLLSEGFATAGTDIWHFSCLFSALSGLWRLFAIFLKNEES